jgi:hypothetical protein
VLDGVRQREAIRRNAGAFEREHRALQGFGSRITHAVDPVPQWPMTRRPAAISDSSHKRARAAHMTPSSMSRTGAGAPPRRILD